MRKEGQGRHKVYTLEEMKQIEDPNKVIAAIGNFFRDRSANFKPRDLGHSLEYLISSVRILQEDHERCYKEFEGAVNLLFTGEARTGLIDDKVLKDAQFWLRLSSRAFMSEVEGTAWAMRQVVLWANERTEIELSDIEKAQLSEQPVRRSEGEPGGPVYLRADDAIVFSLEMLARVTIQGFRVNKNEAGWQSMKELIRMRNQITHPKELIHLQLDLKTCFNRLSSARRWWYASLKSVLPAPA